MHTKEEDMKELMYSVIYSVDAHPNAEAQDHAPDTIRNADDELVWSQTEGNEEYDLDYLGTAWTTRLTDVLFTVFVTATRASALDPFEVEYNIVGDCFLGETYCDWDALFAAAGRPRDGIVAGFEDHTYRPSLPVNRGAMAVYLTRAMLGGEEVPTAPISPSFPDVPTDYWSYQFIEYIKSQGVTAGYLDGKYHPEYVCTRDQMAVYVARAFELSV